MNTLLLFFALPIATIILAIVLQKILKCPILVAATFFAVYLIVTYAVFNSSFLVFAIAYTILAYISAILTKVICELIQRCNECRPCNENCCCNNGRGVTTNSNLTTVSNGTWCCTSRENPTIAIRGTTNTQNVVSPIQEDSIVILNNTNNGRTGNNCCCRRR